MLIFNSSQFWLDGIARRTSKPKLYCYFVVCELGLSKCPRTMAVKTTVSVERRTVWAEALARPIVGGCSI